MKFVLWQEIQEKKFVWNFLCQKGRLNCRSGQWLTERISLQHSEAPFFRHALFLLSAWRCLGKLIIFFSLFYFINFFLINPNTWFSCSSLNLFWVGIVGGSLLWMRSSLGQFLFWWLIPFIRSVSGGSCLTNCWSWISSLGWCTRQYVFGG